MTHAHVPSPLPAQHPRLWLAEWLALACVLLLFGAFSVWRGRSSAAAEIPFNLSPHLIAAHVYTSPNVVISQVYGGVRDTTPLSGLVECPTDAAANGKIVDFAGFGAAINFNPYASGLATPVIGGQNLYKLTLTSAAAFTIPVVIPKCGV